MQAEREKNTRMSYKCNPLWLTSHNTLDINSLKNFYLVMFFKPYIFPTRDIHSEVPTDLKKRKEIIFVCFSVFWNSQRFLW